MEIINELPYLNLNFKDKYTELDDLELAVVIYQNFKEKKENIIVIKENLYHANKFYNVLKDFIDETYLFGFDESLVVETIAASPELNTQRLNVLKNITSEKPKVIISHSLGVVKPIINKNSYFKKIMEFKINDEIDFNNIIYYLYELGYQKVSKVTMPFEFSIRGSVIDIFPFDYDLPIRIDTFDDQIDSLRLFDVATQRSRIQIDSFKLFPASIYDFSKSENIINEIANHTNNLVIIDEIKASMELNRELFFSRYYNLCLETSSILDYIDNPLIITSSYDLICKNINLSLTEAYEYLSDLHKEQKAIDDFQIYLDINDLLKKYIDIKSYRTNINEITYNLFPLTKVSDTSVLQEQVSSYLKDGYQVIFLLSSNKEIEKYQQIFKDKVSFEKGNIQRGFVNNESKIVCFSDNELSNKTRKKSNFLNKYSNAVDIDNLDELKKGDFIVHQVHGIGKYLGIKQLKVDNIMRDYLWIEYKNDEKLYIPIEQFNMIKKYSSTETSIPKLSTMGGADWKKTKLKVQKRIEDMMDELLELYAIRNEPIGYKFQPDNYLQKEFEAEFEYELTRDQAKAIDDVKKDMESNKVMDRLICGDVGYGKTEVAIRAIFKAVTNHKQVAFLCPTTILSRQHYLTLIERFQNFPINVVLLTRNTSSKKIKEIKEDLALGKIDVLVGTHKILGNDINFKDLGLLVIDEEQRFGVKHKEKIKQLKSNVDVITLSATPIPRTLQMSLSGLRKTSLLQTPPINRVPIQTYVVEKNKYLIKEVIERELSRNGQVFYLHNNTKDIEKVAKDIEKMFKDAKVAIIHGKMDKNEVEQIMEKFDANEYQVLVCTTIIETGIDIPNANTIIIENANKFGLAQLYQIKGRVGRSDRVGYAYLMYEKNALINDEAYKRLQAIKELTSLGSGYKIALRDLAIRGAGDILGKTQAGNIETVGYDMYLEMLEETIAKRKGTYQEKEEIENINIKNAGFIPDNFQVDDDNRIRLYQKIYNIKRLDEFKPVINEIRDLYGKIPLSIVDIIEKRRFEILVSQLKGTRIFDEKDTITIQLNIDIKNREKIKKLYEVIDDYGALVKVEIKYQKIHLVIKKLPSFLKTVNHLLFDIKKL